MADSSLEDHEHPGAAKKFQDENLQALLHEDPCQTQEQLAQKLNVTQKAISDRLKAMERMRKFERIDAT